MDLLDDFLVENVRVGNRILNGTITVPDHLKKYIKTPNYFIEYDKEITDNQSILNIPLLSNVLPLAWITDTNIKVSTLDKRYHESMYQLKDEINKIFPLKPFKTEIIVDDLVENSVEAEGTALLFSGGVDSTYSLINNWEKKPHLVMIWGIDMHPYPEYAEHWSDLESLYGEFAAKNGLEFSMVRTNASQVMNYPRIEHDYHRILHSGRFRLRHQHSLIVIPMVAPFSDKRFNEVLFAASDHPHYPIYAESGVTFPRTDEKIVWADLVTRHDGFIPRIDKLQAITEFPKTQDTLLKVCQKPKSNCCSCDKCYREIMYLALNGIDPNKFGFNINEHTYEDMRTFYEFKSITKVSVNDYFASIKRLIPDKIDGALEGSKPFLEWFKDKDLNKNVRDNWSYRVIYNKLPYSLASIYDKMLSKMRINIHPNGFDIIHFPKIKELRYEYE